MSHQFSKEKAIAIEAVRTASRICRSVQSSITKGVLEKKDRSPVTIADFASQAVICRSLEQSFPDDPIIGEENSSQLQSPEQASFLKRILDEIHTIVPAAATRVFPNNGTKSFTPKLESLYYYDVMAIRSPHNLRAFWPENWNLEIGVTRDQTGRSENRCETFRPL